MPCFGSEIPFINDCPVSCTLRCSTTNFFRSCHFWAAEVPHIKVYCPNHSCRLESIVSKVDQSVRLWTFKPVATGNFLAPFSQTRAPRLSFVRPVPHKESSASLKDTCHFKSIRWAPYKQQKGPPRNCHIDTKPQAAFPQSPGPARISKSLPGVTVHCTGVIERKEESDGDLGR